jgi:excisionase family DNA binding protein
VDTASDATSTQLLTVQELSARSRLSPSTIHRLKREGKIPFFQPAGKGGRLLFPADAIERVPQALRTTLPDPSRPTGRAARHLSGPPPAWMRSPTSSTKDFPNAP